MQLLLLGVFLPVEDVPVSNVFQVNEVPFQGQSKFMREISGSPNNVQVSQRHFSAHRNASALPTAPMHLAMLSQSFANDGAVSPGSDWAAVEDWAVERPATIVRKTTSDQNLAYLADEGIVWVHHVYFSNRNFFVTTV